MKLREVGTVCLPFLSALCSGSASSTAQTALEQLLLPEAMVDMAPPSYVSEPEQEHLLPRTTDPLDQPEFRIIGGAAVQHDVPWMASLQVW